MTASHHPPPVTCSKPQSEEKAHSNRAKRNSLKLRALDKEFHNHNGISFSTVGEVCARLSLGTTTVYKLIAKNDLPSPILLSDGRKAFVDQEIDQWIMQKIAASRGNPLSKEAA